MNLGIAGDHCSGKDSAAKYLEGKGLVHISLSDFLKLDKLFQGKVSRLFFSQVPRQFPARALTFLKV